MLTAGEKFDNPKTGALLEIVRAPGDGESVLELRRTIRPRTGKTIPHVHRDYLERFVVEAGEALATIDGREQRLGPGDELEVQIG
jgi:mannose-6-phosphate isomerase-like protein (cupin superfamily)